jgi:hypothetical protein
LTIILVVASQFRRQLAEVEVKDAFVGGIGLMRYAITSLADLVAGIEPDVSPPPPLYKDSAAVGSCIEYHVWAQAC